MALVGVLAARAWVDADGELAESVGGTARVATVAQKAMMAALNAVWPTGDVPTRAELLALLRAANSVYDVLAEKLHWTQAERDEQL